MRFRICIYLAVILFAFSCKEKESFKDVNVAVHGVSGLVNFRSFFVDNTIEAMNYAFQFKELDGIEIDVQFNKEENLWMFHDEFLDDRTNREGSVCEKSDEFLRHTKYKGLKSPSLAKLADVDWSLMKDKKNIYLDLKLFNSCQTQVTYASRIIEVLDNLVLNEGLTVFSIINNSSIAEAVNDAGYQVYVDVDSFQTAKQKLALFYAGIYIRNSDISSGQVAELQESGKKVILFDMFSISGIKDGFRKHPDVIFAEDFKGAIIERN